MSHLHRTRRQKYNVRALQYFLDNRKDIDKSQLSHLLAIQDKTKGLNEFEVEYGFKTDKKGKDCRVAKLGYGRIYGPVGSAEYLDNTYRENLYAETEFDVDIKNCHPTLLIQLAKKNNIQLPEMEIYVKNREEYLQQAIEYYSTEYNEELTRTDMKTKIISVLYGAKAPGLDNFRKELDYLTERLKEQHPTLYTAVCELKERNKNGAFLAYLAQTEERKCLEAMDTYLFSNGRSVDALAYDGLMVRKEEGEMELPDELLRGAESFVKERTGYEIHLEVKPMEISIDLSKLMTKEEKMNETYQQMKQKFEMNHFYFERTNTIVRENENGKLQHFEIKHANVAFNGMILGKDDFGRKILFMTHWIQDPDRKIIRELVMKMPEECSKYEYSLFRGFDYKRIKQEVDEKTAKEYVEIFEDLVLANSGDEEIVKDHVMKGFAHMIQKPFKRMNVLTAFATPDQGTGKDTMMLIIKKVIGDSHTAHYTSTEQYWDKHDTKQEGAIFVYLEEACSKQNKEKEGQLKARITADVLGCNPKGIKGYDVPNVGNQYMTTNEPEPFKITEQDRRGFLIKPSARLKNQDWGYIYELIYKPEFIRVIGEYLEKIDLNGWKASAYPETAVKTHMKEFSKTPEAQFIEQWDSNGKWVLGKDLFRDYKAFCDENGLIGSMSMLSMCKKLLHYKDKYFIMRKGGKNLMKYASPGVKADVDDEE